jgi:hypothetical protein
MKRLVLLLFCTALIAYAGPALATGSDEELLIGYTGFDYEDPDTTATYLAVGDGYKVVGFVTQAGPLLTSWIDFTSYEYTIYIRDLTVSANFFTFPNLTVLFNDNGRGSYYRDDFSYNGGTAATYGTNPPNLTAPSTFIDGSERVTGDVDGLVLVYSYSANQGNFAGSMTLDGGPDLIYIPAGQRAGWTLSGLLGPPNATIPAGYDHQVDGECHIPGKTPTAHKTWGALKALYR